jgi:hypothetical protein
MESSIAAFLTRWLACELLPTYWLCMLQAGKHPGRLSRLESAPCDLGSCYVVNVVRYAYT